MNLLNEAKKDVAGLATIKDWLGEGAHVPTEQASGRAAVCLKGNQGSECPHHHSPKWWEIFKNPIADAIKRQIELKARMKLSTPHDENLAMCSACGCCMSVKIWVPIKHVKAHTTPEMMEKFPPYCWQKREIEIS